MRHESETRSARGCNGWVTYRQSASAAWLPARRYASAGTSYGPVYVCLCPSVCHKSEFYRNG